MVIDIIKQELNYHEPNPLRCGAYYISKSGYRNHQSEENVGSCWYEKSSCLRCEAYHGHKAEHKIERTLEKCLILWYNGRWNIAYDFYNNESELNL